MDGLHFWMIAYSFLNPKYYRAIIFGQANIMEVFPAGHGMGSFLLVVLFRLVAEVIYILTEPTAVPVGMYL